MAMVGSNARLSTGFSYSHLANVLITLCTCLTATTEGRLRASNQAQAYAYAKYYFSHSPASPVYSNLKNQRMFFRGRPSAAQCTFNNALGAERPTPDMLTPLLVGQRGGDWGTGGGFLCSREDGNPFLITNDHVTSPAGREPIIDGDGEKVGSATSLFNTYLDISYIQLTGNHNPYLDGVLLAKLEHPPLLPMDADASDRAIQVSHPKLETLYLFQPIRSIYQESRQDEVWEGRVTRTPPHLLDIKVFKAGVVTGLTMGRVLCKEVFGCHSTYTIQGFGYPSQMVPFDDAHDRVVWNMIDALGKHHDYKCGPGHERETSKKLGNFIRTHHLNHKRLTMFGFKGDSGSFVLMNDPYVTGGRAGERGPFKETASIVGILSKGYPYFVFKPRKECNDDCAVLDHCGDAQTHSIWAIHYLLKVHSMEDQVREIFRSGGPRLDVCNNADKSAIKWQPDWHRATDPKDKLTPAAPIEFEEEKYCTAIPVDVYKSKSIFYQDSLLVSLQSNPGRIRGIMPADVQFHLSFSAVDKKTIDFNRGAFLAVTYFERIRIILRMKETSTDLIFTNKNNKLAMRQLPPGAKFDGDQFILVPVGDFVRAEVQNNDLFFIVSAPPKPTFPWDDDRAMALMLPSAAGNVGFVDIGAFEMKHGSLTVNARPDLLDDVIWTVQAIGKPERDIHSVNMRKATATFGHCFPRLDIRRAAVDPFLAIEMNSASDANAPDFQSDDTELTVGQPPLSLQCSRREMQPALEYRPAQLAYPAQKEFAF